MDTPDNPPSRGKGKRSYRGHVQAEVRDRTRQRIIEATIALYSEAWIDQITLEQVAQRAGVTVQTVLRHFGSKEALIGAAGRQANDAEQARRGEVPVADIGGAIAYLMDHYETTGDQVLRGLAQEDRHPAVAVLMEEGRAGHRAWVARVFGAYLAQRSGADRERLLAQLITICDVYTWKLLRRQAGLSREQTALAIHELLLPLLADRPEK
ncbi:MAG TPA: TetR/AcrR family transcriptional regulator [Herpetosiphonaceae bacterium]|nr:TetR/AcrR family transcriptional regulator [Herpetosiphonaceae bacterium]